MVVGLDLDAERRRQQRLGGVAMAAPLRPEAPRRVTLHDGGVVAIRDRVFSGVCAWVCLII